MDFRWSIRNQKLVYGIILLLLLSKSWSLPAVTFGIQVFVISGVTILFLTTITQNLWLSKKFIIPLIILILIPIVNMGLHGKIDISRLLLNLLLFLITLFGYNIAAKIPLSYLSVIFKIGLILNIIFGTISIVNPDFFTPYAEVTSSLNFYFGRAYGFFLQPNAFAYGLLLNLILLYGLTQYSDKQPSKIYLYIATLLIILSGSRIGIAFSMLFLAYYNYIFFNWKNIIFLVIASTAAIVILSTLIIELKLEQTLIRIESIRNGSISSDNSLNDRIEYQIRYLDVIKRKPLIGYGFGTTSKLKETGVIIDVAHQSHLDQLLEGGILQYLFFLVFLVWLGSKVFIKHLGLMRIIPIIFFTYSFFSSSLMTERITFLAIGIMIFYENSYSYTRNERRGC